MVEKLGTFLWAPDVFFDSGVLVAQIYAGDNDSFGLMYGVQDTSTYYRFSVDHQRSFARLVRVDDGVFTVLSENLSYVPPLDLWTTWMVERDGALHRVLCEGQTVLTATDAAYVTGSIALYSWGMSDLRFDDIAIFP